MAPVTATFRFYEELNDFIARPLRRRSFSCVCPPAATAKHMIEALGVPHTEVELILVNGESVGFERILEDGDRVAVYPKFEALDIRPLLRVRAEPLRMIRFVADAHLGGLAQLLRLAGFDTLYDNHYADAAIEALAAAEQRIVLTRDRELLKRRTITHGCYVRALKPEAQLREIFGRLDLAGSARPFRLCLTCNAPLRRIEKEEVADRAPQGVLERHTQFVTCDVCRRVFWEGSHWRRMRALMDAVVDGVHAVHAAPPAAGGAQ
ncbi:twitching motility protein PilT [Trinickia violacea]|uniref:Twitching motility protein PilT n=1 Tax=Trinickia violacea TaxID=2571746 RepID=A0A4P8IS75_9BURK|nr:Mut7-C RNAse domain-containing protein [Trinickia violacea]QCP51872.1 twitching motility protein PilT [Trinickia violacea]